MKRRTRQALLIAATTAFIIITPLLVLYALGYRLKSPRIGVLLIESTPSRAAVTVNDEAVGATPQTITNVDSDSVHIRVAKTGYLPWQKRLPLARGGTTEVRSVRLFPEKLLTQLLAESVSTFSLSPNRAFLAVVDSRRQLSVLDENGAIVTAPKNLPAPPKRLLWSPDSASVLILDGAASSSLLSVADGSLRTLTLPNQTVSDSIVWDPRLPGRLLLLGTNGDLIAFEAGSAFPERLATNIAAFAPTDRSLIVASRAQALLTLDPFGRAIGGSMLLPQGVKHLFATPAGAIAIVFMDGTAATIDTDSALQPLANLVHSTGFSPSGHLLYVQTAPHELMAYNLADEQIQYLPRHRLHLITRVSEAVSHPQWFAGGEHLIYQIADRIFITEIDTRDHAITTEIDSTNLSDSQIAVGRDGDSLFYLKRAGDKVDLIRTSLIAE